MLVRTGMYRFEVSRTALYRVRYVLARTSTYHLVLPCTRCTGFQMFFWSPPTKLKSESRAWAGIMMERWPESQRVYSKTRAKALLFSIMIFRVEKAGSAGAAHSASRRQARQCCFRFKGCPMGGSSKLCLYSRQGVEQLLMSTVVQSDLLSCCRSHCIKYRISPPFLEMFSEVEPT